MLRLKTGRVPCNEREMREPEFAGKARSFIESAQQQLSARGDCSHAHTRRDVHRASLTPLTGAARAQLRKERARAQHRLRGAQEACGALITRHVTMGAYTNIGLEIIFTTQDKPSKYATRFESRNKIKREKIQVQNIRMKRRQ